MPTGFYPRKSVVERFWARVDKGGENECWNWTGALSSGYGTTSEGGKTIYSHRWVYEHVVGPIPVGFTIDHLCRNRRCVNPVHLEPVTHWENNRRGYSAAALNVKKTHCINGHEYTEATTYYRPDRNGTTRSCKTCEILRYRKKHKVSYYRRPDVG